MKKIVSLICIVLAIQFANAQSLEFGLKAGLNTGKSSFNELSSYSLKNNETTIIQGGVYAQFKVWLIGTYIQPELLITRKTNSMEITGILNSGTTSSTATIKSNDLYLNVPIYIGKEFFKIIRIYAGPNFQMLINPETSIPEYANLITKNDLSKFVTGFAIGAGLNILKLRADIRWDYSGNLGSHIQINQNLQPSLSNGMISVQLGYKIFGK
jgi:hypothetical protein